VDRCTNLIAKDREEYRQAAGAVSEIKSGAPVTRHAAY
jgi:hypothetical protein